MEENDKTLETFNIDRDKKSVIPMIQDAMEYGDIRIFMSPWSPLAYMKTNGEMNHGGKLKEEYHELWSPCYVKFIEAYKKEGINIGGITVQNEPIAVQTWDSSSNLFCNKKNAVFMRLVAFRKRLKYTYQKGVYKLCH